jgi:AraC-like DNA-binding protein
MKVSKENKSSKSNKNLIYEIRRSELVSIVGKAITEDGCCPTDIPFLTFLRSTKPTQLSAGILRPSVCFVAQGGKKVLIGKEIIHYKAGNFIIAAFDMPISGQIEHASEEVPYLGIKLELDPAEITSVILDTKIPRPSDKKLTPGAYIGGYDPDMQDALLRLIKLLSKPQDIKFLAPAIKREIIYRLLTAENGYLLYKNVIPEHQELGIGKAITLIKENYSRPLRIENLAKEINMSVSSFHHKFKTITTMGPLQYQKQIRLQEARRLLLTGTIDAATACFKVGYESPSQFSREYRRLFGAPPLKDIQNLRSAPPAEFEQN